MEGCAGGSRDSQMRFDRAFRSDDSAVGFEHSYFVVLNVQDGITLADLVLFEHFERKAVLSCGTLGADNDIRVLAANHQKSCDAQQVFASHLFEFSPKIIGTEK
jgi:hypothetical protein